MLKTQLEQGFVEFYARKKELDRPCEYIHRKTGKDFRRFATVKLNEREWPMKARNDRLVKKEKIHCASCRLETFAAHEMAHHEL